MKPIIVEIAVSRSLPVTFAIFTDLRKAAERVGGIQSLDVLTGGPVRVGTQFRETRVRDGKLAIETRTVECFAECDRVVTAAQACGFRIESQCRFVDLGGGETLVELTVTRRAQTLLARVLAPFTGAAVRASMRKKLAADMADLKAAAECGG